MDPEANEEGHSVEFTLSETKGIAQTVFWSLWTTKWGMGRALEHQKAKHIHIYKSKPDMNFNQRKQFKSILSHHVRSFNDFGSMLL